MNKQSDKIFAQKARREDAPCREWELDGFYYPTKRKVGQKIRKAKSTAKIVTYDTPYKDEFFEYGESFGYNECTFDDMIDYKNQYIAWEDDSYHVENHGYYPTGQERRVMTDDVWLNMVGSELEQEVFNENLEFVARELGGYYPAIAKVFLQEPYRKWNYARALNKLDTHNRCADYGYCQPTRGEIIDVVDIHPNRVTDAVKRLFNVAMLMQENEWDTETGKKRVLDFFNKEERTETMTRIRYDDDGNPYQVVETHIELKHKL